MGIAKYYKCECGPNGWFLFHFSWNTTNGSCFCYRCDFCYTCESICRLELSTIKTKAMDTLGSHGTMGMYIYVVFITM